MTNRMRGRERRDKSISVDCRSSLEVQTWSWLEIGPSKELRSSGRLSKLSLENKIYFKISLSLSVFKKDATQMFKLNQDRHYSSEIFITFLKIQILLRNF